MWMIRFERSQGKTDDRGQGTGGSQEGASFCMMAEVAESTTMDGVRLVRGRQSGGRGNERTYNHCMADGQVCVLATQGYNIRREVAVEGLIGEDESHE